MQPNQSGQYIVGVDVGGTNVRAAVVDAASKRAAEDRNETRAPQGPEAVTEQIAKTIEGAIGRSKVSKADIAGVGCGMPGRIDPDGVVLWSPNFPGIEGFPLVKSVSDRVGLPVWMENDVNVASLGEFQFGAGRDVDSLVMLTLGTGIGGGIILNRQLWPGVNAGGGEIGHMVVNPGGRRCGCGNHGCLEAMAQRDAIVGRAEEKIQTGRKSLLAEKVDYQVDQITPALIAEYGAQGDEVCVETMAETGFWVGVGVANLINILNPQMVIIGGGISQAGDILWGPLLRTARAYAIYESRVVCKIVQAELGDDAGIMGGVCLALRALGKN